MNSKILCVIFGLLIFSFKLNAQNENQNDTSNTNLLQNYGFDKHKLFAGGSVNIGYGSGNGVSTFAIGALPEIGYTFKNWLDLGLAFNINYYSGSEYIDLYDPSYDVPGYKATSYGAGIFARVHPFEQFFFQVQPEIDNYSIKQTYLGITQKYFHTSTSYLTGIGWGQRIIGESSFYTLIMVDLGNEKNTPYKDAQGNVLPVIRAGFNLYF